MPKKNTNYLSFCRGSLFSPSSVVTVFSFGFYFKIYQKSKFPFIESDNCFRVLILGVSHRKCLNSPPHSRPPPPSHFLLRLSTYRFLNAASSIVVRRRSLDRPLLMGNSMVKSLKEMRFVSACLAKVAWLLTLSIYSR